MALDFPGAGLSSYTSSNRSRNKQRLDSEYSNVLLDGTAPMSSSSRPIMSTSQKRMLGAQGQGYAPQRPEDATMSTVKPQLYSQGLKLPSGQNYNGYNAPNGQFFMNGLPPNTGPKFQYDRVQLAKQAKAEEMRQQRRGLHRTAEALRAQQWMDPIVNANVQSLGLQHPSSQRMLGQMYQQNAQIPWAQQAIQQAQMQPGIGDGGEQPAPIPGPGLPRPKSNSMFNVYGGGRWGW